MNITELFCCPSHDREGFLQKSRICPRYIPWSSGSQNPLYQWFPISSDPQSNLSSTVGGQLLEMPGRYLLGCASLATLSTGLCRMRVRIVFRKLAFGDVAFEDFCGPFWGPWMLVEWVFSLAQLKEASRATNFEPFKHKGRQEGPVWDPP